MDKDIKELIRKEILNNLEIVLEEEIDAYTGKQCVKIQLYYDDELVSETDDITLNY